MIISDYDKFDYDYQQYWKDRSYEHKSELIALRKLFNKTFGEVFLDIGGSYGRLVEIYYEKFETPIILDFSLKTLQKNRDILLKKYPRLNLIAANVYNMPFKENVFDGAMMVRVLHHIENPEKYFKQLSDTMKNRSTYVQEYANKNHIKAKLKALLRGNFRFFSQETYQQPTQGNFEGSNGHETVFLNFHPKYIERLLENSGFKIKKALGVSYLRIPFIKRLIPQTPLLLMEMLSQAMLSWTNISPSIFVKTRLDKPEGQLHRYKNLLDTLACPKCKGELEISENTAVCNFCPTTYKMKKGVWDFRIS